MKNFDKLYDNIDECVNEAFKKAINLAVDGVRTNVCGPFGAAVIQKIQDKYKIISVARNEVVKNMDVTSHAEICAIKEACKVLGKLELDDCILISTAKSCPMCLSAACWSRIPVIKYALEYEFADNADFLDRDISLYFKGESSIIKEEKVEYEDAKIPFLEWNKNPNKVEY